MNIKFLLVLLIGLSCSLSGYAQELKLLETAYVQESNTTLLERFAPVFLIEDNNKAYNKIGTPSARYTPNGRERVYVDDSTPTLYTQTEHFTTERGTYTNLIYRVHFSKNPFTWVPFNVGAGKNVGAFVVITLDEQEQPVFVTTVQSCGCYHAIMPTNFLDSSAYAEHWSPNGRMVYGEYLPGQLEFTSGNSQKIVVSIRSGSHRTKGLSVMDTTEIKKSHPIIQMTSVPMELLKTLPLEDGHTTSFYHESGRKKGLVKGAFKPMETVLFGLWAWDSHVGQDREYGPKDEVGRRFYTTLQFSKKKKADMWDYAGYLRHNGWKP